MAIFVRELARYLSNSQRGSGCVAYDPIAEAPTYGYVPNLAAGIIFSVVFFFSLLAHTLQVARSRKWWYSSLALGALGECIGWAGRAAAHECPYRSTLFSLQISILIICCSLLIPCFEGLLKTTAPCFLSAALYYILSQMIRQYGRHYSFIGPRTYLVVFIAFDVLSIVIQAVGGGLAASAGGEDPPGDTEPGTHTMLAGIIIQLVSMSSFGLLWIIFLWRARAEPIPKTLILTTTFSAFCIIVRNFYRAVELAQGWEGYLITHEVYFDVLDGALMAMAVGVFNLFFPTRYFTGKYLSDNDAQEIQVEMAKK